MLINNSRRKDEGNQCHDGGCTSDTKFCCMYVCMYVCIYIHNYIGLKCLREPNFSPCEDFSMKICYIPAITLVLLFTF